MKIGYEAKRIFHNKTGLGNYSRDLIRILAEYFPENNYLLFNPKKAKETLFIPNEINVFEKLPFKTVYKTLKNYWRQKAIVNDLTNNKVEIFHGLSGELPVGLKKANIKTVVTIHDLIFMRYPNLYSIIDKTIYFHKFKKAAEVADIIIAISQQTKKDIIQYLGISEDKIIVVYQGCNNVFKIQYSESEKKQVANKYNLPNKFILNVGTIEERKNALTIVKAIYNTDIKLVLVGKKTKYADQIDEYVRIHGMQNQVIYLYGVELIELAIIYQLASVFVYPSIFEGFGIPIIEALYSKIPVITNKNGVFPEAAGSDSLYIDTFDVDDLAIKIKNLMENEVLRKEIASKSYEFVQKFNDEEIAKEMMQVYQTLIHS